MKNIIKEGQDFRIIPSDIEGATTLNIVNCTGSQIEAVLGYSENLKTYEVGSEVEIFGSTDEGLIYFKGIISKINNNKIILNIPNDFTKVQRREYSRINFDGSMKVEKNKVNPVDISAGGIKFITNEKMIVGKNYSAEINLNGSTDISCTIQPIRIYNIKNIDGNVVCARYTDINSSQRVLIVQYAFRMMLELENKSNA